MSVQSSVLEMMGFMNAPYLSESSSVLKPEADIFSFESDTSWLSGEMIKYLSKVTFLIFVCRNLASD